MARNGKMNDKEKEGKDRKGTERRGNGGKVKERNRRGRAGKEHPSEVCL